MARLTTRAPAKINLTLHVVRRRPDGYHELDSLVAFAGAADTLSLDPGPDLDLVVDGPQAGLTGPTADNLVLKAARRLAERRPGLRVGRFRLTKRLPSAAGIGGGSSDAAAALRLLAELNGLPVGDATVLEAARRTGADVPVCLEPRARVMRGIGDEVGPALSWTPLFGVLVNPRVEVPTPAVFAALGLAPGQDGPGMRGPRNDGRSDPGSLPAILGGRNDLQAPAVSIAPVIAEALRLLEATADCRLARMSGSGATVFGLYPDRRAAGRAARSLAALRPAWWVKPTVLR